jgi:hypothetical protein
MNVPGHDPNELWQKFSGSRGTGAWTTVHVGEVIEIRKGIPENIGKCTRVKARQACRARFAKALPQSRAQFVTATKSSRSA